MTPDAFDRFWKRTYPDAPPVGYMLREAYVERWFRIHTLPNSERYPESDEEMAEILRRHHTLLTDVIGAASFVLVLTGYSETPRPVLSNEWLRDSYPDSQPFASIKMNTEADAETYWHFFMVTRRGEPNAFDDLLRRVAEEIVANVLFVNLDNSAIYAPYDGGADVILPSSPLRDAMRERYATWLSTEPTGL